MARLDRVTDLVNAMRPYWVEDSENLIAEGITRIGDLIIDDTTTANSTVYLTSPGDGNIPTDCTLGKYGLGSSDKRVIFYLATDGIVFIELDTGTFTYKGFFHSRAGQATLAFKELEDSTATKLTAANSADTLTLQDSLEVRSGELALSGIYTTAGGTGFQTTTHLQGIICCDGTSTRCPSRGVVAAGTDLEATGRSFVCAGTNLESTGSAFFMGGGFDNTVTGRYGFMLGGDNGQADGDYCGTLLVVDGYNKADNALAIGVNVKLETTHGGSSVWGDSNATNVSPTTTDQLTLAFQNGCKFYTNGARNAGAELLAGATAWSVISDETMKEGIKLVDDDTILVRLCRVPVNVYRMVGESDIQIGPTANDWHSQFSDIFSTKSREDGIKLINQGNQAGVLHACIRALNDKIDKLEQRLSLLDNATPT